MRKLIIAAVIVALVAATYLFPRGENLRIAAPGYSRSEAAPARIYVAESSDVPRVEDSPDVEASLTETPYGVEVVRSTVELELEAAHLARELEEAKRDARQSRLELERCRHPEATPYGWFLALPEAATISPEVCRRIEGLLTEWPLFLTGEEALWISERYTLDDWKAWAETVDLALTERLGVERLLDSLPEDRRKEARQQFE